VEEGTDVTLECSSDVSASSITWSYDGAQVTGFGCTSSRSRYVTESTANDCHLTALGNYTVQGPYGCSDSTGKIAQAVVIVIGKF